MTVDPQLPWWWDDPQRMKYLKQLLRADPTNVRLNELARLAFKEQDLITETEWHSTLCPYTLLNHIQYTTNDRKWRLLAVASVREIEHWVTEDCCRKMMDLAERHSDGLVTDETIESLRHHATRVAWPSQTGIAPYTADFVASQVGIAEKGADCVWRARWVHGMVWQVIMAMGTRYTDETRALRDESDCQLIREIFGNPFRPMALDAAWHAPTVIGIARSIYEQKQFSHMPLLADALEEAGCHLSDVLHHCRSGEQHWRGCWLLDVLLAKD